MTIARSEVLRRAHAVTLESDWYDQGTIDNTGANTGYRRDCSGWVSYCWKCPTSGPGTWGGYSTESFVTRGIMVAIPWADLRPGDAIGHCGPGSAGNNGHICLFLGWANNRHGIGGLAHTLEHGGGWGPDDMNRTVPADYQAFRLVGIVEDDGTTTHPGTFPSWENNMFCKKGDGGDDVKYLQLRGLSLGGKLPRFGADSSWGAETSAMLAALGLSPDVFGAAEALKLDQLERAASVAGAQVPAAAITGAVRTELAKLTAQTSIKLG